MIRSTTIALALTLFWTPAFSQEPRTGSTLPDRVTNDPLLNSRFLLFGSGNKRKQTLAWAARRGNTDMVAPLLYAMRFSKPLQREEVIETLQALTGRNYGDNWFRWRQWQQAHPEIRPFKGFDVFLSALLGSLDPGFKSFIYPGVEHSLRLEEIVWGGVSSTDGIPPINHPELISAEDAGFLSADEPVFGIALNGDVRAYPYRIMDWHEMLNDSIGGMPVTLAYCTLCGSGILYRTDHQDGRFEFGSSGLLYQSNKLMFDRQTNSLWNQFTGRPVVGTLTNSGIQLESLPLVTSSWGEWLAKHPDTKVLGLDTGYERDYTPGKPYGKYFKSSALMFPTLTNNRRLKQKAQVFGLRIPGAQQAWPLRDFRGGQIFNDQVGVLKVVVVGDEKTRTVRAYRRGNHTFSKQNDNITQIRSEAGVWTITEAALVGPQGQSLGRLPGHLSYWFAWHNYFGGDSLVE